MPGNSSSPPSGIVLSLEDVQNVLSILPSDAIMNESSFMGVILEAALFGKFVQLCYTSAVG